MRNPTAVVRALERMNITVSGIGQAVVEDVLRKLGAPIQVRELPQEQQSAALTYSRMTPARYELYVPRGASELAVIHELLHSLLPAEGYLFPMVWHSDRAAEGLIVNVVGGLFEAVTHPIVRRRMEDLGLDLRLFRHVRRAVPRLPEGQAVPTATDELQLALGYLLQALDFPAQRLQIAQEFAAICPAAAVLGQAMLSQVDSDVVTTPQSFRAAMQRLLALANKHVQEQAPRLKLSLYVPLAPVCTVAELARPAKEFVRLTDSSVFALLEPSSTTLSPPTIFLLWKSDDSSVQVRALAHSALLLQVKDELRTALEQPLRAFLDSLEVPYWAEQPESTRRAPTSSRRR